MAHKAKLRLNCSATGANSHIFLANTQLANAQPSEALATYTKVIYHVQPGHPCALLNRAVAYLALGYPELAAADAYRAAQIAGSMRGVIGMTVARDLAPCPARGGQAPRPSRVRHYRTRSPQDSDERELAELLGAAQRYWEAEEARVLGRDGWTRAAARFPAAPAGSWRAQELAGLVLCDTRADGDGPAVRGRLDRSLADAIDARALFRLCGALWECGAGAVSDALGLLEDVDRVEREGEARARREKLAVDAWALTNDDLRQFRGMGRSVLHECARRHQWAPARNDAFSRSKVAMVNRVVYPWDQWHPDMENPEVAADAADWLASVAPECRLEQTKGTEATPWALRLVAAKPVAEGDVVIDEPSVLYAFHEPGAPTSCHTCGATVLSTAEEGEQSEDSTYSSSTERLEDQLCESFQTQLSDKPNESNTATFRTNDDSEDDDDDNEDDDDDDDDDDEDVPPGLEGCGRCMSMNCTLDCQSGDDAIHGLLCNRQLVDAMRNRLFIAGRAMKGTQKELGSHFIHPTACYLYHKLLAKILAVSRSQHTHPLWLDETRWLNGGFYAAPPEGEVREESLKSLPWSFDSNIVMPGHILQAIGVRPWQDIEKYDAWIMNTLFAKIEFSAEVSTGFARRIKVYDRGLKSYVKTTDQYSREIPGLWAATIHPAASLAARVGQDGAANVKAREDDPAVCCATADVAVGSAAAESALIKAAPLGSVSSRNAWMEGGWC